MVQTVEVERILHSSFFLLLRHKSLNLTSLKNVAFESKSSTFIEQTNSILLLHRLISNFFYKLCGLHFYFIVTRSVSKGNRQNMILSV